jgi:putative transposase
MTHPIHSLALRRGELALYKGQPVEIEAVLGFDTVQIRDLVTGGRLEVEISHLSRRDSEVDSATDQTDFRLTGKWREIAEFRLEVIKPLLNSRNRTRADVKARATEFNYRPNALYEWIAAYEGDGTLSSLGRKQRSDTSKTTFDARTEDLISNTFKELKSKDKHLTEIYKTIRDKIAAKNAQEKANTKNSCCDGLPAQLVGATLSRSLLAGV